MTLSSTKRSKYALAVQIAGGLALACLDRASPVGVLGVGELPLHYRPSLSRGQVLQWLHRLRRYRVDEATTLGRRLAELAPTLHERSLVVCLSDLHDPEALKTLCRLGQQHDTVVVHLIDPAEGGLKKAGFLRAREAETGRTFSAPASRVWADPQDAARELRRARVDHLALRTDQPFVQLLRQFFAVRGLIGRGAK